MTTQHHKQPRPGDFCFCSVQLQLAGVFLLVRDPWAIAFAFALLLLPTAPPPGDFVGTPPVQLAGGAPFGEEPLDIGAISVMCHVLGSGSWCFSLLIYDPACSTSCHCPPSPGGLSVPLVGGAPFREEPLGRHCCSCRESTCDIRRCSIKPRLQHQRQQQQQ